MRAAGRMMEVCSSGALQGEIPGTLSSSSGRGLHACKHSATMCRGIALSPEEISAQILRHLISQAEDALATAADAAVRTRVCHM